MFTSLLRRITGCWRVRWTNICRCSSVRRRRRNTARKCAKKIGSEYKQGPCPATAPVPLSRSMRPMLARSPLRKGVKPPDVYIGLFPWRADGSVYRLGLQPACWFVWQLFCRDGEHGRRALRDELGTVHCSLFFLSGLDAVCRRAGGGRVRGRNRIPDRTGQYQGRGYQRRQGLYGRGVFYPGAGGTL